MGLRRAAGTLAGLALVAGSLVMAGSGTASACPLDADGDCHRSVAGTVTATAGLRLRAAPYGTVLDTLPYHYSNTADCYVQASDGSYWDWIYDTRIGRSGWVYDPYLYTGGNIYQQVDEVHEGNCAPPPVTTPANVTATAIGTTAIGVTWTDTNSGYAQYVVSNGNVSSADQPAGSTSYTWGGLAPNMYMCFTVAGKQGGIQSPWSPYACTTTLPGVPAGVTVTALTAHTVLVDWSPPPGGAGQYVVSNGNATTANLNATTYLWRGIEENTYMCFTVAAKNATGQGAWSSNTCVTTPHAPPNDYVNLGDSMSSGEGTQNYDYANGSTNTTANQCHRSTDSYSGQYLGMSGIYHSVDNVACSGAVTDEYKNYCCSSTGSNSQGVPDAGEQAQNLALSPATDLVTVSFGINNLDFAGVLKDCYEKAAPYIVLQVDTINSCFIDLLSNPQTTWFGGTPSNPQALSTYIDQQESVLEGLFSDIQSDAPNATVVVVTYPLVYPRHFNGDPSSANTGQCALWPLGGEVLTSQQQLDLIYAAENHLDSVIRLAASNVGVRVLDEENAFFNGGHDLCAYIDNPSEPAPWVNTAILSGLDVGNDSFHPNTAGYHQIAQDLRNFLGY